MDDGVRSAIKDIIRQFKYPGDSDLDAAINVISNHAETIRRQIDRIEELENGIKDLWRLVDRG